MSVVPAEAAPEKNTGVDFAEGDILTANMKANTCS